MSCIKEILRIKGDKEILIPDGSGLAIEGGGEYKGHEYIVTFNRMGFRCGYVAIPTDHPLYNEDLLHEHSDIRCHGGITFYEQHSIAERILGKHHCQDKWLGFDAGHAYDLYDRAFAEKHFDIRDAEREHMDSMSRIMKDTYAEIRTCEYMENQCHHLIDQLIGKTNEFASQGS